MTKKHINKKKVLLYTGILGTVIISLFNTIITPIFIGVWVNKISNSEQVLEDIPVKERSNSKEIKEEIAELILKTWTNDHNSYEREIAKKRLQYILQQEQSENVYKYCHDLLCIHLLGLKSTNKLQYNDLKKFIGEIF